MVDVDGFLDIPKVTKFAVPMTQRAFLPRRGVQGIYFLYVRTQLIYIGASTDVAKRLSTHGSSEFTHYRYVVVKSRDLLLKLERRYLVKYKPPRNSPSVTSPDSTSPFARIGYFCQLPERIIDEIKRRTTPQKMQWQVITEAIDATRTWRKKK